MEITLLIKSIVGLVFLLGVLLFFLFYIPRKRKLEALQNENVVQKIDKVEIKTDLLSLLEIIRNKESTTEELENTICLVLKYHGKIHDKLGIRPHPDFDIYGEIILRICRHKNTTKDIILKFDRELENKNENYKKDINDCLTKGLNSRGF